MRILDYYAGAMSIPKAVEVPLLLRWNQLRRAKNIIRSRGSFKLCRILRTWWRRTKNTIRSRGSFKLRRIFRFPSRRRTKNIIRPRGSFRRRARYEGNGELCHLPTSSRFIIATTVFTASFSTTLHHFSNARTVENLKIFMIHKRFNSKNPPKLQCLSLSPLSTTQILNYIGGGGLKTPRKTENHSRKRKRNTK